MIYTLQWMAVFQETLCRRAVGMHWGTFRLTDEPMGEPQMLLERALRAQSIAAESFKAGVVGEIIDIPRPLLFKKS